MQIYFLQKGFDNPFCKNYYKNNSSYETYNFILKLMESGHNEEIFRQRLLIIQTFYEQKIEFQFAYNCYEKHKRL